jgi:hypothetical protein
MNGELHNPIYSTDLGLQAAGPEEIMTASTSGYMQRQLEQGFRLYTKEEFKRRKIIVERSDIENFLIPSMQAETASIIFDRTKAAVKRAKQHFLEYGRKHPNEVTYADCIVEALRDSWWRKGPRDKIDPIQWSARIQKLMDEGKKLKIGMRIFPDKVQCPLKCRAMLPDLSEALSINVIFAITGVIENLYKEYRKQCGQSPERDILAKFIIISEGQRWAPVWDDGLADKKYRDGFLWWIKKFGFENHLEFQDNETYVLKKLGRYLDGKTNETLQEKQLRLKSEFVKRYQELMDPIFDPTDIKQSLKLASERDPIPDSPDARGRFVALFESTLYSIHFNNLEFFARKLRIDYDELYQRLTVNNHLTQGEIRGLSKQDETRIRESLFDRTADPNSEEVLNYLRILMLKGAWQSTILYVAEVAADRGLGDDPVLLTEPDLIRATIHPKAGQFGLNLNLTRGGAAVESWHGTALLKEDKEGKVRVKIGTRLEFEQAGASPVCTNHPTSRFEMRVNPEHNLLRDLTAFDQPLFYWQSKVGRPQPRLQGIDMRRSS